MCICLKISHRDWVTARHTSACITVLYVDFNFTRTETATMTDYRQLYSVTGELRKLPQQQNSGSHSICKCDATYSGGIVDFVRDGLNLLRLQSYWMFCKQSSKMLWNHNTIHFTKTLTMYSSWYSNTVDRRARTKTADMLHIAVLTIQMWGTKIDYGAHNVYFPTHYHT